MHPKVCKHNINDKIAKEWDKTLGYDAHQEYNIFMPGHNPGSILGKNYLKLLPMIILIIPCLLYKFNSYASSGLS